MQLGNSSLREWLGPFIAAISFVMVLAAFLWQLFAYAKEVRLMAEQELSARARLAASTLAEPLRKLDLRQVQALGERCRREGLRLRICVGHRFDAADAPGFFDSEKSDLGEWVFGEARAGEYVLGVGRREGELTAAFRRALVAVALAGLLGIAAVVLFFVSSWRQRLRIAELAKLERFRREFIADFSHEIKTPLTGIIGAAEMMSEGDRLAAMVKREAKRIHELVQGILDLARLDRPGVALNFSEVDLEALVNSLADRYHLPVKTVGASIRGDARLLESALVNLIENAKRHAQASEIALRLTIRANMARLSVIDNGIGIPSEHAARIFERFYRVDPSRGAESGGTGLGLAIVRRIARLHGGEATYTPASPRGSQFTIALPI